MPASTTRMTYYNGLRWHVVLLPDGARAVWLSRLNGQPLPGSGTRYYRGRDQTSRAEDRQPALAASPG